MSENVKNFINSVQKKDYTAAKDVFQGAMAEKISAAFENKKIELASQMSNGHVFEEEAQIDEKKKVRQLKDPKTEMMVVKNGKVEVIDKKDVDKYMKKGYELAEGTQLNEGSYDIPWMDEWSDNDVKKWERKYKVSIFVRADDSATVDGKDSDIKKFVTKELDFEEPELEMMGLK